VTANVLRLLLGFLLLATAAGKLADLRGFARVLASYEAFPPRTLIPIAAAVALLELAIGAWLLWGRALGASAATAAALHVVYAGWAAATLLRGLRPANCGCFGVFYPRPLGWHTVVEDLVVAALATWLALRARRALAT
jgi:uncharacterized membrane protein YphA (DoxX/SURF4 family)